MTDDQKAQEAAEPVPKEAVVDDKPFGAKVEDGDDQKASIEKRGSTSGDRARSRSRTTSPKRPSGARQKPSRLSPTRNSSSSRPSVSDQARPRSFRIARDKEASDGDAPKRPSLNKRANSLKNFKPKATPVKAPIDLSGLAGSTGLDDSEKSAGTIASRLSQSIQKHNSIRLSKTEASDAQSVSSQSSVASRLALSMNKHQSFRTSAAKKEEQSKAATNAQGDLSKRLAMSVQKSLSLRNVKATVPPVSASETPDDLAKRLSMSVQKSLSMRNVKANTAPGAASATSDDLAKRLSMSVQKSLSMRNLKPNASPGISPSTSVDLSRGSSHALSRLSLSVQRHNSLRNMNGKGLLSGSQTGSVLDLSLTDQLEIPQSSQNWKGEAASTSEAQNDLAQRLSRSVQKSLSLKNVKANVSTGLSPVVQDDLNKRLSMSVQKSLSLRNMKATTSPGISPSNSVDLSGASSNDFASRLSLSVQKQKSARSMNSKEALSGSRGSILDLSLTDQLEMPQSSQSGKGEATTTSKAQDNMANRPPGSIQKSLSLKNVKADASTGSSPEAQDALNKRLAMSVQKSLSLRNVKADASPGISPSNSVDLSGASSNDFVTRLSLSVQKHKSARDMNDKGLLSGSESLLDVSLTDQLEQSSGKGEAEATSTTEAQDALNKRLAMSVQKSLSLKNMKASTAPVLSPSTSVDLTRESSDAQADFASRLSLSVQKHKSARDMSDKGVLCGSESLLDVSLTDQLKHEKSSSNGKTEEESDAQASFSNRLALSVQKHKSARNVGEKDVSSSVSGQNEKPKEISTSRAQDKRSSRADDKQDSKKDNRPRARALSPIRQQSFSHRRSRGHSPKREDSRSSLSSRIEKPELRSSKSTGSREGESRSSSGRPSLSPVRSSRGGRPSLSNHFGKQRSFRHGKSSRDSDTQSLGDHLHKQRSSRSLSAKESSRDDKSSRGSRPSLSNHFGKQRSFRHGKSKESSWDTRSVGDHLHKQRSSRSLSAKDASLDALSPSSRGSRTSRNQGGGLSGSLRGSRLSTSSRGSRTRRSVAQSLELPDLGDIPSMPDGARYKTKDTRRQEDCESTASLTVDQDEMDDSCAGHSVASRGLVCSYRPDSSDAELSSVGELSSDEEDAEMTQLDLGTPLANGNDKSKPTSPQRNQNQVNNMNGYFSMTDFLTLSFGVVSLQMEYAQTKVHEGASYVINDFSNSVDYMQATCEGWATSVGSILQSMVVGPAMSSMTCSRR